MLLLSELTVNKQTQMLTWPKHLLFMMMMMMIVDQCVNQQSLVLIRSLSECWFFDGSDLIHNRCNMLNF